jgi:hypothetical protein
VISESIVLLSEYSRLGDWEEVSHMAFQRNLLRKRSSHTIQGIVRAARKRFLQDHGPLPSAELLSRMVSASVSERAKAQALFTYLCASDRLVEQAVQLLVRPRLEASSSCHLTVADVVEFIDKERGSHPELGGWSEYLKRRWARGFLALLRDFDLMEPAPSKRLTTPLLRVEAFTFLLLGLLESGLPPAEALKHPTWNLFLLDEHERERLLAEAQARGWIYYSRAGEILELKPRYPSLEEWLCDGLGC